MKIYKNIILILLYLIIISCNTQKKTHNNENNMLENSSWELIIIENKETNLKQTLLLENDKVNGNGGCNGFFGKLIKKEQKQLSIIDISSTKMYCPNLDQEKLYLEKLRETESYNIQKEILILYNNQKQEILKFKKL